MEHEVAALRSELAALRREVRRRPSRLPVAVVALLVALVPVGLFAANPFNDLNVGSVHNGNIDAIYNAGITRGCVPNTSYCPNDYVTREEMASFLARVAGLGGNPAVANAKTAQTAITALTATLATTAANATNATNATNAADAALLQGFPASGLVRANVGASGQGVVTLNANYQTVASVTITLPGPGFVLVVGSVTIQTGLTGGTDAEVKVNLGDRTTTALGYDEFAVVGTGAGSAFEQTVAPSWVFQATAGGARTFDIIATRNPVSSASARAFNGTIAALYVPFGPGGAVATGDAGGVVPGFTWPPAR